MKKDREKKSRETHGGREKEEKDMKKAESGLSGGYSEEDEVTMSFLARKLKDSCPD